MEIPDTLQHKIDVFKASGLMFRENDKLFTKIAWQQVMIGQNFVPDDYHPTAQQLSTKELDAMLETIKKIMDKTSVQVPSHAYYIKACLQ